MHIHESIHGISKRKLKTISELVSGLKQCGKRGDLERGKILHLGAAEEHCHTDKYVAAALINMYGKCRSMLHAQAVFEEVVHKDVVLWTSLIQGYVENGECSVALQLFTRMDCEPNPVTFVAVLKACTGLASEKQMNRQFFLEKGMALHREAKEYGFDSSILLENTLVDMYSKCGSMQYARAVFDNMIHRDAVSWTNIILGYVENGESLVAMELFTRMDCEPDSVTYIAALKACAGLATSLDRQFCLERGIAIHKQAKERGFDRGLSVANTLIDMYTKCGSMQNAQTVFDNMVHRNAVSWNILILGYVENGQSFLALEFLACMNSEPDSVTFVAALKACTYLCCLEKGIAIHRQARERGLDSDVVLANALITMYSKCRSMLHARSVFDGMTHRTAVSWTSLILGYVENGESLIAMDLFSTMDCKPDSLTFGAILKACADLATEKPLERTYYLEKGTEIHIQAKECGVDKDMFVETNLVEMYIKCGSMEHARSVFDSMTHRNAVSWNIIILGYVENGESLLALDLFMGMDCEPSAVTFAAVLKACASVGTLTYGRVIHSQICKLGCDQEQLVTNCLVDLYGKCGNMDSAEEVFNGMSTWDNIVSWNALIGGYSSLGDTIHVFRLVKRMHEGGLQMNGITLVCILTACSHAAMVEEGKMYFKSMSKYGITPSMEHYHCMVYMLGRGNRLQEALSIVKSMSFKANHVTWTTLLGACRDWGNLEVGKVAFDALVAFDEKDAAPAYVLMGEIYAKLGVEV